ncbi:hypothetical protein [Tenacibaculum maritimum]|uniref:hypothetical protein n=1 Tax=Tenacibaculum maritimum TaxID=107401 RepID=UPI0012E5489F|nr:hypothetical protein [Tenacibaculum maritimum]CAA0214995.1 hypothetical protein TMP139_360061 [Tenacibaculum maritimum]CAA0250595.1 hypothetical protein TMP445_760104 [Tenacibaculum maritimum]
MQNTIEINKIKPFLKKKKFYDFFINYVPSSFDAMKKEMSEIVAENRNIEVDRAVWVKSFRVSEVEKFIISNDLQGYFLGSQS